MKRVTLPLTVALTAVGFLAAPVLVFLYAPLEREMGFVQKIFYFHVPCAWVMFLGAFVCGGGSVTCRFTHVYPDGPAPYYSFSGMAPIGGEAEAWQHVKDTATRAVVEAGGTCTHHHAVGRMHRPGYDRQVPALFQESLRAVKKTLDPSGILNPGVLIDP